MPFYLLTCFQRKHAAKAGKKAESRRANAFFYGPKWATTLLDSMSKPQHAAAKFRWGNSNHCQRVQPS